MTSGFAHSRRFQNAAFLLLYICLAVVMTWPLARHLGTRLAADLGDPAFNAWVLQWTTGQMLSALHGHLSALADYWNGNIFYPERLTLAYSEHLTAEAIQILPVYAASGNIILCYNLLFIATFALSGVTMHLLVRDLTGQSAAAFIAGLAFAYAPYRLGQFSHLQVLSSYWMPLVLLGLRRYFIGRNVRALAGSAAAMVAQNLSCGYYMLFFTPFVAAYAAYELIQRRLFRIPAVWTHLALAAAGVIAATWPFVRPYFELRNVTGLGTRSPEEIVMFSADTHAFATIASNSRWLGERLNAFSLPEGQGFIGFTILAFVIIGMIVGVARLLRSVRWSTLPGWHLALIAVSGAVLAGSLYGVAWFFVAGRVAMRLGGSLIIYQSATRPLLWAARAAVVFGLAITSGRRRGRHVSEAAFGFFAIALVAAVLLALGPRMHALGRNLGPGPYAWLLLVPGFDGLRVPARFLMLVAMFGAVLAGLGAAALFTLKSRRMATALILAGAVGILAESWTGPLATNQPVTPAEAYTRPPAPGYGRHMSPIYLAVHDLPKNSVLIEFPFGEPAYDVLAVLHAGYHRQPLVNGYSGFFPVSYLDRVAVLHDAPADGRSTDVLRDSHATHAIVHEAAYANGRGPDVTAWLLSLGATPLMVDGPDRLFALK